MTPASILVEGLRRVSVCAILPCIMLLHGSAKSLPAQSATSAPDATALRVLVDSVISSVITRQHIPGAAFVFVQNGRTLFSRGYGVADLASRRPVSAESTLFRIGSITKVFTSTAVMQLSSRRQITLDEDVNRYLKQVRVPADMPQRIHASHLLSHTAGFDEVSRGRQAGAESGVLPLSRFLADRLTRVREPGLIPTYSTYGMTLAGLLVEDVSGQPFEHFLTENIWTPLGMHDTRITLTPDLRRRLATPYEYVNGVNTVQPYEWYHTTPASSINSTATDMAKFIAAHLARRTLMDERSFRVMHATQARGHPDVPGMAYGFFEGDYAGVRVLEHGGAMAGASAFILLLPDHNAGFFVASQHEGNSLGTELKEAILDRFYRARPTAPVAARVPDSPLQQFAGMYRWNVYCHRCGTPAPTRGPTVAVDSDTTITFAGQRWIRTAPLLFRRVDGARVLGFRQDSTGRVSHLFIDGPLTFERIE